MKILTVVATTGLALSTFSFATEKVGTAKVSQSSKPTILITLDKLKAFPTAEGAGANATGGRGGKVIYVKNHNAFGEGSLRWALNQQEPRTILFAVGGRFNINRNIRLRGNHSNVTLAGQTANDIGGVHLAQSDFNICNTERAITLDEQKDIVFRYFDSRYNWQYLLKNHDISGCPINPKTHKPFDFRGQHLPTLRFVSVENLIIDHVSSGWSSYGLAITNKDHSNVKTGNITVQRSLMHEGIINPAKHGQNHNIGMLLGTKGSRDDTKDQWNKIGDFSIHKNAFIGVSHRMPNTAGGENAKFRVINNYIYGFNGDGTGSRLSRIGGNSKNDFVNNVYQEATYGAKFVIDGVAHSGENANNLLGFQYGSFLPMIGPDGAMETPKYGLVEKPNFYIDGNLFLNTQGDELDITSTIQSDPKLMTFRYFAYAHDMGYYKKDKNGHYLKDKNGKKIFVSISRHEAKLDGQHLQLGPRDNLILRNNPLSMTDALAHPVSILPSNHVKENLLANVGGNVRYREDGSTYIDDPIDRTYIGWARNNSGPEYFTKLLNDEGVGSYKNFVYPNYVNGSRNLATYDSDKDGMPNTWEKKHQLGQHDPDPTVSANAVRADRDWEFKYGDTTYLVRNNAGYTNLEMYLADIAGDFHMLAKTEGKPINTNKDVLKSIAMPSVITSGTVVEVPIEYSANAKRVIKCYLQTANAKELIAFSKIRVNAGSGTTACELNVPANTPSGDNYRLYTYMTKENGKHSELFSSDMKSPIKISAFKDALKSVSMPSVITPATVVEVPIEYSANAKRVIKCYLQTADGKGLIAFSKTRVNAGSGTTACELNVPANTPSGDNYRLYTYMTKENGKYSELITSDMKRPIKISALTDHLNSVNMSSIIKAGNDVTAYINYSAKAKRNIRCYINDSKNDAIGFSMATVSAGVGVVDELDGQVASRGSAAVCNFKLPANTPEGDYSFYAYMVKPGGKWSERLGDGLSMPVKVTPNTQIPLKDGLSSIHIPNVLKAGTTVVASIGYSATSKRKVKCYLETAGTNTVHAYAGVFVNAGTGVAKCNLKVPANISKQDTYQLYTYITKESGKHSELFEADMKGNLKISSNNDGGGKHHYEVVKSAISWQAASEAAQAKGGYLAVISSAAENAEIYNLLKKNIPASEFSRTTSAEGGNAAYVWIGANDRTSEGKWIWNKSKQQFWSGNGTTGKPMNNGYNNWGIKRNGSHYEPDNSNGQDAAAIALTQWPRNAGSWLGKASQWNDLDENDSLYYVIEYDAQSSPSVDLFIIGDSTIHQRQANIETQGTSEADNTNDSQIWGIGDKLHFYMKESSFITNLARPGSSSKSYYSDAKGILDWPEMAARLRNRNVERRAYLFIHFGHNDANPKAYLHTEPGKGKDFYTNLKRYADYAKTKGVIPVLVTSTARLQKDQSMDKAYQDTIRQLASDENILVLDLREKSFHEFDKLTGKNEIIREYGYGKPTDTYHFGAKGASKVASWLKGLACGTTDRVLCNQFK